MKIFLDFHPFKGLHPLKAYKVTGAFVFGRLEFKNVEVYSFVED
ncbi:MAG TPA: hypothetical protein VGD14_05705 [bacterium]